MKKIILPMGVLLLAFSLLAGCTTQKQVDDTASEGSTNSVGEKTKDDSKVCCESYGYGSEMKKCCETYEWTEADKCTAEEGLVGGGKEVVDDSKCE